MKPKRKRVTLTNVDVMIATTPTEVRNTLHLIATTAENNVLVEADGSPQKLEQAMIAEVLTIAAWEIESRSRQHWHESSDRSSRTHVDLETIKHRLLIHSLHDAQASCLCGRWGFTRAGCATISEIEDQFSLHAQLYKRN